MGCNTELCQDYAMRLPQFISDILSKFVKKTTTTTTTTTTKIDVVFTGNRSSSLFHFSSFNTYSESHLSGSRSCTTRRHQIGSLNRRPAVSVWGWRGAETAFSTSTKRGCTADACLANRSVAVPIPRKAHHKNPHSCSVVFRWLDYDGGRQCLLLRKRTAEVLHVVP